MLGCDVALEDEGLEKRDIYLAITRILVAEPGWQCWPICGKFAYIRVIFGLKFGVMGNWWSSSTGFTTYVYLEPN